MTNLSKRYGDRVAVEDVSFSVEEGEIYGILGPNGAGKTTTVECVEGLRQADGGRIEVLGLDPRRDATELHRVLGAQLQESGLPDRMRVGEALDLYGAFYRRRTQTDLLEVLGLADKRRAYYKNLSGGQKQRLSIALALVGDPKIAVLDELTTGLDPQARRDTWTLIEQIRDRGVTIVLVTHFMEEAERLCDRVAVIDHGRVRAVDTPGGLVSSIAPGQRVRFRPSERFADALLTDLPEVHELEWHGPTVVVTGDDAMLQAVTATLARHRIIAADLRLEQANLDDAFVALTTETD